MTVREQSPGKNWAGNYGYGARRLHGPSTLEELQEIVAGASRVRALGSRHSFNGIADSEELVSLENLPADVVVDREAGTVTVSGAMKYGDLAQKLNDEGLALHNLASLPHISVAGAVATATHGSGDENGNLATAVSAIEMVTSDGEVLRSARGEPDFDGLVVGLGALGVVTRVTLDVEPAYEVRQRVFEGLSWGAFFENFDEITARGYSVSLFTGWGEKAGEVWIKDRVTDEPERVDEDLFGAIAATVDRHPILELDAAPCSPQLGVQGLWSDRLSHFRMGFTPSVGEELQSEYLVPRHHAIEAMEAVRSLAETIHPTLMISEIRTIAADDLWMSMAHGHDTVGIHFTWKPQQKAVETALTHVEAALAPFGARPHWGKLFLARAVDIPPLYELLPDFISLTNRLDPKGTFRNQWLETHVLGPS